MAIVRSTPLKDFRVTALSTTAQGTAYSISALSTGQKLYGKLTLTDAFASTTRVGIFSIQSATASAFASPTTQIQFTCSTAKTAEYGTPVSAVSTEHIWFRAAWLMSTTATTNGTWKGLVEVGVR